MVELREITADNLDELLELRVAPGQESFVSTVAQSLAQAWVCRDTAFPFAVYNHGAPVGFIMLGYYTERDQYTLWKFLIDEKYQHKGYGKQALKLGIDYLVEHFGADEIYTGVAFGNRVAKALYASAGFVETGLTDATMLEMRLDVGR